MGVSIGASHTGTSAGKIGHLPVEVRKSGTNRHTSGSGRIGIGSVRGLTALKDTEAVDGLRVSIGHGIVLPGTVFLANPGFVVAVVPLLLDSAGTGLHT